MFEIVAKRTLNPAVVEMDISAPLVAKKAQAGQFIILRTDENGERIPLTVAGCDRKAGMVKVIFQVVGATTAKLNNKNIGDSLSDFVGPLGIPSKLDGLKNVCVIGGGVGCAIALPIADKLHENGTYVTGIIGFRNKDLVILQNEFKERSNKFILTTDDGSCGVKGNVTNPLKEMLDNGEAFDEIIAVGPLVMMKYVALTAKPYGIPLTVSMNPIMIDGTGMCGCCRLTLIKSDGTRELRFACVDGPDFNGYEVDFDEAIRRSCQYREFERKAHDASCNLLKASPDRR